MPGSWAKNRRDSSSVSHCSLLSLHPTGLLMAVWQLLRILQRDPKMYVTSISMFVCGHVYVSVCTHSGNGQDNYVLKLCLACAALDENVPHSLRHLNTWSLVGGAVWRGEGGVAWLEELYHGGGF